MQLRVTWELKQVAGFDRPPEFLANYSLPPEHWAQLRAAGGVPGAARGDGDVLDPPRHDRRRGVRLRGRRAADPGLRGAGRRAPGPAAAPWRLVAPWRWRWRRCRAGGPTAFYFLLQLPGLGSFRAPARYTLLTSLGLVLLAGRGLDLGRSIAPRRFWAGWPWRSRRGSGLGLVDPAGPGADFRASMGADTIAARFAAAGLAWALGPGGDRRLAAGRVGAWAPVTLAAVELARCSSPGRPGGAGRPVCPGSSPVLRLLARCSPRGLVAGRLLNVPVDAGLATAYP